MAANFSNDDHPDRVLIRHLDAAVAAVDAALDIIDGTAIADADRNRLHGADKRKLHQARGTLSALRHLAQIADRTRGYGGTPHEPKASIPVVQDGTTYLDATQGLAAGLEPTHLVTPIDNFTPHDDVCRCVYPEKCFCAESLKPTDPNGV